MIKKRYSIEFKDEACKLVTGQGYSPSAAAAKLGVGYQTLDNWLRKRGWKPPLKGEAESDDPGVLKVRIRDLEARLRRAEMEKDILKKATAYFAKEQL